MKLLAIAFIVAEVLSNSIYAQTTNNSTVPNTLLRFIFNNNVTLPGMTCSSPTDRAALNEVFSKPNVTRTRQLRQAPKSYRASNKEYPIDFLDGPEYGGYLNDMDEDGNYNHRAMQQSLSYCRNQCERYTPGYCHVVGCAWFNKPNRRDLQSGTYGLGVLSNTTWCADTAAYINNELDQLIDQNLVSEACQTLLDMPRVIQCYSETVYGLVETFNLYNADTDLPIQLAMGAGYKICSGTRINFVVKANACVKNLRVIVNSTNVAFRQESYDTVLPVSLFPRNGNDYDGEVLPNGNYTITGVPDGDMSKQRWRRFFVAPC